MIDNANLLDRRGGDYEIKSTFETASGTTQVEIRKSKSNTMILFAIVLGLMILLAILVVVLTK